MTPRGIQAIKPACPTPHKRQYSTKRVAKTYRPEPRLKPYLCACGEHWHLTKGRRPKGRP